MPIIGHRHPICTVKGQSEWVKQDKQTWREPTCEKKDKGYVYTTITAIAQGTTLHIRFRSFNKHHPTKFLIIKEFKRFTANQVLQEYPEMGRHFNDLIHQVYHDLGIPLGYVVSILRDWPV